MQINPAQLGTTQPVPQSQPERGDQTVVKNEKPLSVTLSDKALDLRKQAVAQENEVTRKNDTERVEVAEQQTRQLDAEPTPTPRAKRIELTV